MHAFVTGGSGFVGSHLVEHLLARGDRVTVFDYHERMDYLDSPKRPDGYRFISGDLTFKPELEQALGRSRPDVVYHFAANADVSMGARHPTVDLHVNTIGTSTLLEAMRMVGPGSIVFASSGAVYGDTNGKPIAENAPFPIQTSMYGASKLAAEALISAYCRTFGFVATICRLETMSGERYHHGVIADFYRKIKTDPTKLEIIGDGTQQKGFIYVGDAVEGILRAADRPFRDVPEDRVGIYNVGSDALLSIDGVADIVCKHLGASPKTTHTGKSWAGDSPVIRLDSGKLHALGWEPKITPSGGVTRTVAYLLVHPRILEALTP